MTLVIHLAHNRLFGVVETLLCSRSGFLFLMDRIVMVRFLRLLPTCHIRNHTKQSSCLKEPRFWYFIQLRITNRAIIQTILLDEWLLFVSFLLLCFSFRLLLFWLFLLSNEWIDYLTCQG